MINTSDFDKDTWAKVEIMAEELGVSVDKLLQIIDDTKQEFYKTKLS